MLPFCYLIPLRSNYSICPYVLVTNFQLLISSFRLNGRGVRAASLARHNLLVSAKTSLSFAAERMASMRLLDLGTRAAHVSTSAGFRHRCRPNPAQLFNDGFGDASLVFGFCLFIPRRRITWNHPSALCTSYCLRFGHVGLTAS